KRLVLCVVSNTLLSKTNIQDGTPARLVTFSLIVSSTMACILYSQSLINDTLLLGVLLNSAQKGILSIKIADKSPKTVPFSLYNSLLPPSRKLLPVNNCEFSLLFKCIHSKSLLAA